jgi:ribose transport system substrate-binding protein
MKKLFISAMIFITALALLACGGVATQAPANSDSSPAGSAAETDIPKIDIGLSLAGEDAFNQQLAADFQSECDSLNYTARVLTAATAEQQQQDIQDMLAAEVSVIVIDPVDVDSLETLLAECETYGVHIINIINPINGYVDTLISPDFKTIGESAGQCAAELFPGSGAGCMMLNTEYDSLTMQLMSDGFRAAIDGQNNISVISEQFCGSDEELAYSTVKAELASKDIDFIFAQSSALAKGAMRAIEESGKDVKLAAQSGDMDIINAVSSGKAHACIFYGPGALAREAVSNADSIIKDGTYVMPQYIQLSIVTAKQSDASGYYNEGAAHAEINQ